MIGLQKAKPQLSSHEPHLAVQVTLFTCEYDNYLFTCDCAGFSLICNISMHCNVTFVDGCATDIRWSCLHFDMPPQTPCKLQPETRKNGHELHAISKQILRRGPVRLCRACSRAGMVDVVIGKDGQQHTVLPQRSCCNAGCQRQA